MKPIKKPKTPRDCKECGQSFMAKMTRAEFCCGSCRLKFWVRRNGDSALLDALVVNKWRVRKEPEGSGWSVLDGIKLIAVGATYKEALIKALVVFDQNSRLM